MILTADFRFDKWVKQTPTAYFIVDEAEQVIEQKLVCLVANAFQGLLCLVEKKVFFYTATFADYWKSAFLTVFELPPSAIKSFPSIKKLATGYDDEV